MARVRQSVLSLSEILLDAADGIELSVGGYAGPQVDESPLWAPLQPQPGRGVLLPDGRLISPQQQAYESWADELFYGGAPGGGKSQLLLGLAITQQHNSVIFRRQFGQLRGDDGLWEKSRAIIGLRGRPNELRSWRDLPGGRTLEFAGCDKWKDVEKYKGRGHDFKGFDELPEFPERTYRFLISWLRTSLHGQRTRVVGAGNTPMTEEGQWVIRYWAPWLDPHHQRPAVQGELRWFIVDADGKDVEVPGPADGPERAPDFLLGGDQDCTHDFNGPDGICLNCEGRMIQPRSRTFIRAKVEDNPYYMSTGYAAVLDSMPEPFRSQMRFGNFQAAVGDHENQVIPTAWVIAAQKRWTPDGGKGLPLTAVGVDVSRGGTDEFVITPVRESWVAEQIIHPAKAAPDGKSGALLIMNAVDGDREVPVQIDLGGVGVSVYDYAKDFQLKAVAMDGSRKSRTRAKGTRLGFMNKRAQWTWSFRELLDPLSGADLALPPDPQLLSDLCAIRFEIVLSKIKIEDKDEIKSRLGRSPDRGESAIYACAEGDVGGFRLLFDTPSVSKKTDLDDEIEALERSLGLRQTVPDDEDEDSDDEAEA